MRSGECAVAKQVLSRATLDNTAHQSAEEYVRREHPRGPMAGACFQSYIHGFLLSDELVSVLPGNTGGQMSPFQRIWQDESKDCRAKAGMVEVAREGVRNSFLESLADTPEWWAQWTCFHVTPEIFAGYRSRIGDIWEVRLSNAHAQIGADLSSPRLEGALLSFHGQLRRHNPNYSTGIHATGRS